LGDGEKAFLSEEQGQHGDGQHRGEGVAKSTALAHLGDGEQQVEQSAVAGQRQGLWVQGRARHEGRLLGNEGGRDARLAEPREGIGPKRIDPGGLGHPVMAVGRVMAAEASGEAEANPVRRSIARPLKAGLVDKGFGEKDRMAVPRLPIPAETAQIGGEDPGGEVSRTIGSREEHETNVLDDEGQSLSLGRLVPADVGVFLKLAAAQARSATTWPFQNAA
jgi:hypothetical protein